MDCLYDVLKLKSSSLLAFCSVSKWKLRNDGFTQWQGCRNFDLQCAIFSRVDLTGQIGGTYTNWLEHSSVSGFQQCWDLCYAFCISGSICIVSFLAHLKDFLVLDLFLPCHKTDRVTPQLPSALRSVLPTRIIGT